MFYFPQFIFVQFFMFIMLISSCSLRSDKLFSRETRNVLKSFLTLLASSAMLIWSCGMRLN